MEPTFLGKRENRLRISVLPTEANIKFDIAGAEIVPLINSGFEAEQMVMKKG